METRHTRNLVAAGPTFDFILVPFLQICFSFSSPCASPFRFYVIWYYFFFCQFGRVNCNWPLHFLCQSTRQPKTSRRTAADNEKKVPGLTKKKRSIFMTTTIWNLSTTEDSNLHNGPRSIATSPQTLPGEIFMDSVVSGFG